MRKKVEDLTPIQDRIRVHSDRILNRRFLRKEWYSGTVLGVELQPDSFWKVRTVCGDLVAVHGEEFELDDTGYLVDDGVQLANVTADPITHQGVSIE